MLRAGIFDMDGLMVDTEVIQSRAFEAVAAEYGVTPEINENGTVHHVGESSADTWSRLQQRHGFEADIDELTIRKRQEVIAVLRQGISPLPGLAGLLMDLQERDIRMAVATNAQSERADIVLGSLGVRGFFEVITTANDVGGRVKPDPYSYLTTAERLGVLPSECVVFEDAQSGVESASAAGMKVIAVPNHATRKMDFEKADLVVPSLAVVDYDMLLNLFS
jgi:HAD superfamily hydrolase (TIGR01509 family)